MENLTIENGLFDAPRHVRLLYSIAIDNYTGNS